LYKYVGGLSFIFLNTSVTILGVWAALGIRSGVWANGFLLTIFVLTFFFAILYSVSTLFGVLTGNALVAIVMTCLVWVIFFAAGFAYLLPDYFRMVEDLQKAPAEERISDSPWWKVVKGIHYVLPRVKDLDYLNSRLLFRDLLMTDEVDDVDLKEAKFSWRESLTVDGVFVAVMLGLACLRFATKDY